jgi:hypothetical protein
MARNYWGEDEMLLALAYYATLPVELRYAIPINIIREVSGLLSRSESSVELRFRNFAARDPEIAALGKSGMFGGGAHVDELWEKFSRIDSSLDQAKLLTHLARKQLTTPHAEPTQYPTAVED